MCIRDREKPEGKLLDALEKKYGSFDNFKAEFEKKATGLFGSGWTWLVKDASGALDIVNESNAGNPIRNVFLLQRIQQLSLRFRLRLRREGDVYKRQAWNSSSVRRSPTSARW